MRYEATCALTEHAPAPLKEAFDVLLVPTLRRWLGMPKGTALCADWVVLPPEVDGAIMPMLKLKFVVMSAMSLRASLKVLRFRSFSSSWLDLSRAFDTFSAKWDVLVFQAQHHGVSLPSPTSRTCSRLPALKSPASPTSSTADRTTCYDSSRRCANSSRGRRLGLSTRLRPRPSAPLWIPGAHRPSRLLPTRPPFPQVAYYCRLHLIRHLAPRHRPPHSSSSPWLLRWCMAAAATAACRATRPMTA